MLTLQYGEKKWRSQPFLSLLSYSLLGVNLALEFKKLGFILGPCVFILMKRLSDIRVLDFSHLCDINLHKLCLYQIANINNCLSFGEYMRMLRRRYLKNDEYEEEGVEEDTEMIRKDRFQQLTEQFLAIGNEWYELHFGKSLPKRFFRNISCTVWAYSGKMKRLYTFVKMFISSTFIQVSVFKLHCPGVKANPHKGYIRKSL